MTRAVLLDFYGTLARATTWGPTRKDVLEARGFAVPSKPTAIAIGGIVIASEKADILNERPVIAPCDRADPSGLSRRRI